MVDRRAGASAALALLLAGLLAGCADDPPPPREATDPAPSASADELSRHDGEPCPRRLPAAAPGEEVTEPAETAPTLLEPESAWLCTYELPQGRDEDAGWPRVGQPQPVIGKRLELLAESLQSLAPAPADRVCTADLGPRHLVVFEREGDLTGLVVDDFGCSEVRLTDEPHETVPGEPTAEGVVPGVLQGPPDLQRLVDLLTRP